MKTMKNNPINFVILVVLLIHLMSPTIVLADDEDETPPPATPLPTETASPANETDIPSNTPPPTVTNSTSPTADLVATSTPTPAPTRERTRRPTETSRLEPAGPATKEIIGTESSTPTETSAETASPTALVTVDDPTLLESVQAIPGETSVVVLDANGRPLPLATQEAADAVALGDPIWCPATQLTPTPGANGCTATFTSLESLLSALSAVNGGTGIAASGTIWIESSYVSSVNDPTATGFTLNGSILSTWANYSLTLQGGWNGVSGSAGLLSNSVFSVPIAIINWTGDVTVNNLTIDKNAGTGSPVAGNGLTVVTNGNINLSNMKSMNSTWDGVYLDNRGGSKNITVTGTNDFSNHNSGASGMYILSNGTVSLSNITSNNSGRGVNISQAGSVSITNGTFNGSFVNNLYVNGVAGNVSLNAISIDGTGGTGTGLYVNAAGAINGNNITSSNNIQAGTGNPIDYGNGAYLIGANGVTLTGTNTFNNNGWTGLEASSGGGITLNNVTANSNSYAGAFLTSASNITLTGTNVFSSNGSHGLYITTAGGTVEMNNITANNNPIGFGIIVENGKMGVTLNNATLSGNGAGMVAGSSSGTITLNGVNASGNWYSQGAELYGAGGVNLTGTNLFSNNAGIGLYAESSNGAITLNGSVSANSNGYVGAIFYGANGVNLTGTNNFNNNGWDGLEASSGGVITLNSVTANSNGGAGVNVFESGDVILNNVNASQNQMGVFIQNTGNVFLSGENISNNTEIGLYVICVASLNFSVFPPNIINNPTDILVDPTCPVPVTYPLTIVAQRQGESFVLDCENADGYSVFLPNGDLVQIFCDVSGRASISRLDNTALPSSLPDGYTYASAFQADIVQAGEAISVIPKTESGFIKASFVSSSLQPGSAYSILYWDNDSGQWIPLKDFMLAENGDPIVFDLNPGVSEDTRKILSGVKLVTVRGEPRVEVSTNFPGIFVLAQR